MIIFPAIDLRRGRCVRLRQGDPNVETVFGDDPAAMAAHWVSQGAEWLHVVNLDGALGASRGQLDTLSRIGSIRVQMPGRTAFPEGEEAPDASLPINLQRLREIRHKVDVPIQFGGGLRTLEDIRLALRLGADRVVLGTIAVERPQLVADAVNLWGPERVVVGLDARDGKVATHGWKETSAADVIDLGHGVHAMGVRRVVFTDIARDGMLSGVNLSLTTRLGDLTGLKVIASGGVANLSDIERLKAHEHYNIEGVIVGQAIYSGQLDLCKAIEVGRRPLKHKSAGIIPYRWGESDPEYLLLYNLFCEQWQFPRGGRCGAEADKECALRKYRAETGLPSPVLQDDFRVELSFTRMIRDYSIERTVIYYLAEAKGGEVRLDGDAHCEARWVSYGEARELLAETGPEQLPALEKAHTYLEGRAKAKT